MDFTNRLYFMKWPEIIEDHFTNHDTKSTEQTKEFARETFDKAHLFLVLGNNLPTYFDLEKRNFEDPLNLPFETCVFECLENRTFDIVGAYTENGKKVIEIGNAEKAEYRFNFIGASEFAPGKYWYFANGIINYPKHHTKTQMFFAYDTDATIAPIRNEDENRRLARAMKARIMLTLELLNQQTTEVGRMVGRPPKIKKKIDGKKEFVKFKPITIIRPKSAIISINEEDVIRRVDWSHRWEVRGHWRRIAGLGKNREGVYCTSGFTWVKEHVKGDESLPVIKKTRVLMNP